MTDDSRVPNRHMNAWELLNDHDNYVNSKTSSMLLVETVPAEYLRRNRTTTVPENQLIVQFFFWKIQSDASVLKEQKSNCEKERKPKNCDLWLNLSPPKWSAMRQSSVTTKIC